MNEREFRVGNYFQPTDGSEGFTKVTVSDLMAWSEGAIYGKPIQLTPEILEAAGFKKRTITTKDEWHPEGLETIYFDFELRSMRNFCLRAQPQEDRSDRYVWENSHSRYIDNLHQLQNFYFALTGQELEIKTLLPQ